MDKRKAASKHSPNNKKSIRNTLTKRQHITIIRELRGNNKGITSLDFRFNFSIIDPPARVAEMKAKGYEFHTQYNEELDHLGQPHRGIARYFLLSEPTGCNKCDTPT